MYSLTSDCSCLKKVQKYICGETTHLCVALESTQRLQITFEDFFHFYHKHFSKFCTNQLPRQWYIVKYLTYRTFFLSLLQSCLMVTRKRAQVYCEQENNSTYQQCTKYPTKMRKIKNTPTIQHMMPNTAPEIQIKINSLNQRVYQTITYKTAICKLQCFHPLFTNISVYI